MVSDAFRQVAGQVVAGRPTPIQAASKAVGAGKWAGLASALWLVVVTADVLPGQFSSQEFTTAVNGLLVTAAAVIGAYRADPNAE